MMIELGQSIPIKKGEYLLWLGGVFDASTMLTRPGVSTAANRWQQGLIRGLQGLGCPVVLLGNLMESLWPRGHMRVDARLGRLAEGFVGELLPYWNLPGIRAHSLSQANLAAFRRLCQQHGPPAVVLTYNALPWNVAIGRYARERLGIPWVCIVADGPGSGEPGHAQHEAHLRQATACVFLSWGYYSNWPLARRFHLDGGVQALRFDADHGLSSFNPSAIVYTGMMNKWGGSTFLVEAFRRVERQDIELWICGKGKNPVAEQAAAQDQRIKIIGVVSEDHLHELSQTASVFVNPRPSSIPGNHMNFPSKVLEYLSYGKPVISTWTGGLSPEYAEVLTVLAEETPSCLAQTIQEVAAWDAWARLKKAKEIASFLGSRKLWSIQAKRLLTWLGEVPGGLS